jgi:hypothetical protein
VGYLKSDHASLDDLAVFLNQIQAYCRQVSAFQGADLSEHAITRKTGPLDGRPALGQTALAVMIVTVSCALDAREQGDFARAMIEPLEHGNLR